MNDLIAVSCPGKLRFLCHRVIWATTMFCVMLCSVAFIGCDNKAPITSYTVERDEASGSIAQTNRRPNDDRMLVGIGIHDSSAWFFKLAGTKSDISGVEETYRSFLESVTFDDSSTGVPQWTAPEEWVRKPGNSFRFATFEITDALEVSISTLTMREDLADYLRINVDRWRREMGLNAVPEDDDIFAELEEIEVPWGRYFVLELVGTYSGGAMGGSPPFANSGRGMGGSGADTGQGGPTEKVEEYVTPDGWEQASQTQFSVVSLSYDGDEGKASITVTALNVSNTWEENVGRWARIVGVSVPTGDALTAATVEMELAGEPAKMIQLPAAGETTENGQSIVAVMCVRGGMAWFVRLAGDTPAVESQNEAFQGFLQSVKFGS